jgi:hypothetical protein
MKRSLTVPGEVDTIARYLSPRKTGNLSSMAPLLSFSSDPNVKFLETYSRGKLWQRCIDEFIVQEYPKQVYQMDVLEEITLIVIRREYCDVQKAE